MAVGIPQAPEDVDREAALFVQDPPPAGRLVRGRVGELWTHAHQVAGDWREDCSGGLDRDVLPELAQATGQLYDFLLNHRLTARNYGVA